MDTTVALGVHRRYAESLNSHFPCGQLIVNEIAPIVDMFAHEKRPSDKFIQTALYNIRSKTKSDPYFGQKFSVVGKENIINFSKFP